MTAYLRGAALGGSLVLSACASQPEDIGAAYVSTMHYENFNCAQVEMEAERVSSRVLTLHNDLRTEADADAAQMAVGMLLLWPTLFFLEGGDDERASEYSRLKGERDALERVSVQKQCGVVFEALPDREKDEEVDQSALPAWKTDSTLS